MDNDLISWHSWSVETFEKAREEDKAIFLSIGYKGCYWCELMAEESFVDEEIAMLLKENFIAIQIDSNDRPDIGLYHHAVFTQMTGREGSYPLSIFMTPQQIPFYSATYIPVSRRDGMMGFDETLELVTQKYKQDRGTLIAKGNEVLSEMNGHQSTIEATKIDGSLSALASEQIKALFDEEHGGFGDVPKFPRHSVLNLLMDLYERDDDIELLDILETSLDAMLRKGLYDAKKGGFHRYSIDREWENINSGKTLYNNALMVEVLLRAYSITDDEKYKKAATRTLLFIQEHMSKDGLYYASYDDSKIVDERVMTAWNAMTIKAIFSASDIDQSYLDLAIESLNNLQATMMRKGELYHSMLDEEPTTKAFLEDYAYLADTLIAAYEATKEEHYLIKASELINEALRQFFTGGRWRFANGEMMTYADTADRDYPSSLSMMAKVLAKASKLINPEYEKFLKRTLEIHSYELMRQPISMPELCRVAIGYQ